MRVENSPEYEVKLADWRKNEDRENRKAEREYQKARTAWRKTGCAWMPMETCPFGSLDNRDGLDGAILVSDGKTTALATVRERFGTPIFYKVQPEYVLRDGSLTLVGGEIDSRPDLPAWWWKWALIDEFGLMTHAGGEETGKEEIEFVPTVWTFLAEPPGAAPEQSVSVMERQEQGK